ncbi:hypothetical protein RvY_03484-1 [Ramazzottius varieornatus]|uniref:Uncharacterized protein n=1 Tax=Ramazzottius varieornatus TaxID=947166 RepID=A0A1D1UN91_RAMVA|nr:hypothetical protein RvY_03484-1 [Ramazzottius varieornatus]
MGNLFASRSSDTSDENPVWMNEYVTGAGKEMYTSRMSRAFEGLSFEAAAEVCYLKLDILLIAMAKPPVEGASFFSLQFILNPPDFIVTNGTCGCFLADSAQQAERAWRFCQRCHNDLADAHLIQPCCCDQAYDKPSLDHPSSPMANGNFVGRVRSSPNMEGPKGPEQESLPTGYFFSSVAATELAKLGDRRRISTVQVEKRRLELQELERTYFTSVEKKIVYFMRHFGSMAVWNKKNVNKPITDEKGHVLRLTGEPRFDSTGMFWWCPPKPFNDILMDRFQAARRNFSNHIVLVVFTGETTSVIGLNNFVQALRSSTSRYEDLHDIVILSDPRFLALEWKNLMSFPKVHLVEVFGLSRADLRAVNIHTSKRTLLLTATTGLDGGGSLLSDRDTILASLTIKAMNFGMLDDAFNDTPIAVSRHRPTHRTSGPEASVDATFGRQAARSVAKSLPGGRVVPGLLVPLLTELINDSNIQFIEQDDADSREFFMAEPFACGHAFATSVLQSLLVSTYFNPFTLNILRHIIFGGITPEFEQMLAEGAGLIGGPNLSQKEAFTDRCLLQQISLQEAKYAMLVGGTYETLLLTALRKYETICLGLYRLMAPDDAGPRSTRRFVICNPPRNCPVLPSDRVFVIKRAVHYLREQAM